MTPRRRPPGRPGHLTGDDGDGGQPAGCPGSVLGVFAHPDDESLAAGGLLARCAEEGARTAVVTATWAPGTGRAGELADALEVLGAGAPRLLGYADARVPASAPGAPRLLDAPLDEVVRRLVRHIRDVRPEVVVTHDDHGGLTGHPDHLHTHRIASLAVEAAGSDLHPDDAPPWRPRELYLATHPHSARERLQGLVGPHRVVHTVPDEHVGVVLDATPVLHRKVAAVLAHRSEVRRGALPGVVAAMPPADRGTLLGTEWYLRRPVGSPARDPSGRC